MNEIEFFQTYEMRPSLSGHGVEVWKRGSGRYGEIRQVNMGDYTAEIIPESGGFESLGLRRTFAAAFALLRRHLI